MYKPPPRRDEARVPTPSSANKKTSQNPSRAISASCTTQNAGIVYSALPTCARHHKQDTADAPTSSPPCNRPRQAVSINKVSTANDTAPRP